MKNNKLGLAVIAGLFLGGCGLKQMAKMAEQQEIVVNPTPLELHGDSVSFDVKATLPPKMLKKNKLYTVKTYYKYGEPGQEFETFEFSDVEFPNQAVEQPEKTKHFSFFYDEAMAEGNLYIKGVASNLEKTKYQETPELEIAKGIITTSRLAKNAYETVYGPHDYNNKEELIPVNVTFHFDQGSAHLKSTEVRGEAGKELDAFIAAKFQTKTVTIIGSHSPEGRESTNEKLSEDRAKVIKDFYFRKMKQYDYKNLVDSIKFETKSIFQDWNELKVVLKDDENLSPEQKKEVLNIVNSGATFVDAQKQIEALPFYKSVLLKSVYPKLRTSKTEILRVKEKKSDAEISILAKAIAEGKASADTLSYEELMYAGTLTPSLEEKEAIYAAANKDSVTWSSANNLGVVYIQMAEKITDPAKSAELINKATTQLEISVNSAKTAENLNNMGVCSLLNGDKSKALEIYTEAEGAKATDAKVAAYIKAGKGAAQIRYAEYPSALKNSEAASSEVTEAIFNAALVKLLTKDFTNAQQGFEKAIMANGQDALAYYCLAIVHARTNNAVELGAALKQAVTINATLKAKAMGDLEFLNYREDDNFLDALK